MPDVLVLCYHAVSDRWDADLSVTPAALRAQLGLLVRRGYRGATFSDAVHGDGGGRTLAVTFDDAFRSVLTHAAPMLRELGLPGTVYVPTAFADEPRPLRWAGIDHWTGGPHDGELAAMTWDELGTLADDGWEIGSHTVSHPRLTTLGDEELEHELASSRESCERALGRRCRSVAYPYGDVDARVAAAAGRTGYEAAAALPPRLGGGDRLRWPRIGVYHADSLRRFRLKVSPAVRRARIAVGR